MEGHIYRIFLLESMAPHNKIGLLYLNTKQIPKKIVCMSFESENIFSPLK